MNTAGNGSSGLTGTGDEAEKPSLLGRKTVLMGAATSMSFIVAGAAQPSSAAAAAVAYVPKWAPFTNYLLGQQVVSPNNDVVSAKAAHKASAAYVTDTVKWALSSTFAPAGLLTGHRPLSPVTTKMITTFGPGHGWTDQGGTSASLSDDKTTFALGNQSLRVVLKNDATPGVVQTLAMPAFSLVGQQLRIWYRIADITNLTSLIVYAADSSSFTGYYQWTWQTGPVGPVSEAQFYAKSGEWVSIILNIADAFVVGTPNRAAITTMRLRASASNGFTTDINWGGIATTPDIAWAGGVVSISFDDNLISQWTTARPIMDTYGYAGTSYVIAQTVDSDSAYLSTTQLQTMERVNGWRVGGHAYYTASHGLGLTNLTPTALDAECRLLKSWLGGNGFRGKDHLAWPLGSFTPNAIQTVSAYFASARSIINGRSTGTNAENPRPAEPYRLHSMSVVDDNFGSVAPAIAECAANKTWLHLTFHDINDTRNINSLSLANFTSVLDAIQSANIPVRTVDEVLALG